MGRPCWSPGDGAAVSLRDALRRLAALRTRDSRAAACSAMGDVAAAEGIALLTAPETTLNACNAPGCVLYFVKDHPRREWCSAGCGNRARAARHYQRHRTPRSAS